MRTTIFIILFNSVLLYVPNVFSHPLTPIKETFQTDWAGSYAGLIVGGQLGHSKDKTGTFGYNGDNNQWTYNTSGFNTGAEYGYHHSFHQLLVGAEIELGYLGMEGRGAQPASPNLDTFGKSSNDFYTTLRARAGTEFHHYLVSLSGGVIGVNAVNQVIDKCNIAPCGGGVVFAKRNGFLWGYTVGAAIEHLLENGWSVKFEYLYFDLGNQNLNGTTNLGTNYNWTVQTYGNIIRSGINYHF